MSKKNIKKMIALMGAVSLLAFTGCGAENTDNKTEADNKDSDTADNNAQDKASEGDYSFNGKSFVITLYPEIAPITCDNFQKLVEGGFYDGLTFHRIVEGFMAQGGDPVGNGTGGSDENIKGEFASNGVDNRISHQKGVISMARSQNPNSASSQFFICYADCTFLDGDYAAFGEVTEGMEVVDGFLEVPRTFGGDGAISAPTEPVVMDKVEMIDADENGNPRVKVTMR
jgi:peptidyl-prolyl cis-trans isomerase B (cyclophilin B)